jgi:hypothetical protein
MTMIALKPSIAAAMALLLLAQAPTTGDAQPAPTFRATCSELRAALRDHKIDGYELVTIEVIGRLTIAHSDGALVYLGMCNPPDPRVLCVTYELEGRKVGDEVVLTGAYIPRGPDHIQLDPCLHHLPDSDGR